MRPVREPIHKLPSLAPNKAEVNLWVKGSPLSDFQRENFTPSKRIRPALVASQI
jgi:hypothetical protein